MKMDFLNTIPYVCERWAELVRDDPHAFFLTEEDSADFTRQQVDELSSRVYAWLLQKGVAAEDFVLIRLPRDARPFIVMLGVWKVGAAFTVVEDTYAPERIDAIQNDCRCCLTVDEAAWAEILQAEPLAGFRQAEDHAACFAIYTSGSTGKPKGVLQEYGKIKLNQASLEARPGDLINENTCMAMLAPINFIAAVKIWMNALYSGMHLVIFSMDTARNPVRMNEEFDRYRINLAFLSPSVLRVMANGPAASLKTLVTGSEAANGIYFDSVTLINNYGMSEAGFHVAQFVIDKRYDLTPIGKPVFKDIRIRLLDEDGKDVPDGEKGEICFDNPFFRGYVNLPEETAKVLRGGIFHSGDMGMRLPDGNIVVTGRLNTMVKINGNRVEPGEIEACMRKIPGIRDAAVKDFRNERQQVFLCAYYTADEDVSEDAVRSELQAELPHYMIPAFFMHLETLPLNRNGKVDRFALPQPDANTKTKAYAVPTTPEEEILCKAYEKVLNINRVGINDDFFELGGDSISTALLTEELHSLQVDYKDIYTWKTPREIAARLSDKKLVDLDALNRKALERDQFPVPYQTYFYDAQLYTPKQTCENNFIGLKFRKGAVDPVRLKGALEAVFAHYAVFSSVFTYNEAGELVIRYMPGKTVPVEICAVSSFTDEDITAFIQPFSLGNELLYRCKIFTTPGHVILAIDTHHLISDGTSTANFVSELFAAYRGEPLRQDHYYAYLESQHKRRLELEQDADVCLLMQKYSRKDYLCNPLPDQTSRRTGNGRYMSATAGTMNDYQRGCDRLRTSLNKLFVAAGLIALAKCSNHPKVTVEWTYNGRDENWKQDLIGLTISSVPVAVDMNDISLPEELIREIDRQNELGMRYADLSLGNNGVTPGERDRMIVVYESGFDMTKYLPEDTEVMIAYDKLNGVFTRIQIILFSPADPESTIPFYINYDSELYSLPFIENFCGFFKDALNRMISGGTL